jgi:hypothetical protein
MLRISDCLYDRLERLQDDDGLHILLAAGIGDVLWALTKLHGLAREREKRGQRVTFHLPDGEQKRAGEYLELLGVQCEYMPHLTTRWVWDRPGSPPIPESGWFSAHANLHLENGRRIESWYPELPATWPRPYLANPYPRDPATEPFVLCFTCTRGYMMGQLPAATWRSMFVRIAQTVAPVRFVGAANDVEFIEDIAGGELGPPHLINRPLAEVLLAMRSPRCVGMFGVAGGPIIAATAEGVPSFLFYPSHLVEAMPGSWEPPGARWDYCRVADAPKAVSSGEVSRFFNNQNASYENRYYKSFDAGQFINQSDPTRRGASSL